MLRKELVNNVIDVDCYIIIYTYMWLATQARNKKDIESDKQRMWMESGDICSGDGGGRQQQQA